MTDTSPAFTPDDTGSAPRPGGLSRGCLIAIVATLLLGMLTVGGLVVGGYYWFKNNKDDLRATGLEAEAEGRAHGKGKDAAACLGAAVARADACESDLEILCQVRARIFLQHCLGAANVPPGFCDGVPDKTAILDTVAWRGELCAALRRGGSERCARVMEGVQDHCVPTAE